MSGALAFNPQRFADLVEPEAGATVAERAIEIPADWSHGLALLADRIMPQGAGADRWAQIVADAQWIALSLALDALDAQWSTRDLFGFDLRARDHGLAVALCGSRRVSIWPEYAIIARPRLFVCHYPRVDARSELLWDFNDRRSVA